MAKYHQREKIAHTHKPQMVSFKLEYRGLHSGKAGNNFSLFLHYAALSTPAFLYAALCTPTFGVPGVPATLLFMIYDINVEYNCIRKLKIRYRHLLNMKRFLLSLLSIVYGILK